MKVGQIANGDVGLTVLHSGIVLAVDCQRASLEILCMGPNN